MKDRQQVTYSVDFDRRGKVRTNQPIATESDGATIVPRVARLLALAIRVEGVIRRNVVQDYADVARLGRVTRARMTQIMKLLNLAPDIQEQILFLPAIPRLNETALRPIANRIDWHEQRHLFKELISRLDASRG